MRQLLLPLSFLQAFSFAWLVWWWHTQSSGALEMHSFPCSAVEVPKQDDPALCQFPEQTGLPFLLRSLFWLDKVGRDTTKTVFLFYCMSRGRKDMGYWPNTEEHWLLLEYRAIQMIFNKKIMLTAALSHVCSNDNSLHAQKLHFADVGLIE